MKKIIFFVAYLSAITYSQWTPASAPYGGNVNAVAIGGNYIYAGTDNGEGVYLSSDNGVSWISMQYSKPTNVSSLIAIGDTVFAGTLGDGIYGSHYHGQWPDFLGLNMPDMYIYALLNIGNNFYAATEGGLYYSPYLTYEWTHSGLTEKVTSITGKDSILFAGTPGYGVYRSIDSGKTWNQAIEGLTNLNVLSVAIVGYNIFASTESGLFESSIYGSVWQQINPPAESINVLLANGTNLYAGSYGQGVFLSTDNGLHWTPLNGGLTNNKITSLVSNGNKMIAGAGNEVFLSTNGGTTWSNISVSLSTVRVSSIYVSGNNVYVSALHGIFLSTDQGLTWLSRNKNLDNGYVSKLAEKGNKIFAATNDGLLFSSDLGENWHHVNDFFIGPYDLTVGINGNNIYLANEHGIFLSTDEGVSWKQINDGITGTPMVNDFAFKGDAVFAADYPLGIYMTTNNGSFWKPINNGLYNPGQIIISSIVVKGDSLFAGGYNEIYVSTDYGSYWKALFSGMLANSIIVAGNSLFTGTSKGVLLSTNNGTGWNFVNDGLGNKNVTTLAVSGNYLLAGTENSGIWRRPLSEMITSVNYSNPKFPTVFELKQNYPNPFNPSTTINYSIAKSGNVKLTVYNAIGSRVTTIVDEFKPAGNYSIKFNGSTLASGIYFYRLESGNFNSTKKLILLK
jgi:photosystem II stability/assembly factor-like uncharacterized protein